MPTGVESNRDEFRGLFDLYLPIAVAVTAVVFAATLYAVIRYRRRDDRPPAQRSEATLLEALVALAIAGIVAVLVSATFVTEARVDRTGSGSVRLDVTAFQWGWRFTYPGRGVTVIGNSVDPPTLALPADQTTEVSLTSRDVIHSFWIPDARFKRDAIPGRDNRFDLVFDEDDAGEHEGVCAEFCGLRHSRMGFDVLVLSGAGFERWLGAQRTERPGAASSQGAPATGASGAAASRAGAAR